MIWNEGYPVSGKSVLLKLSDGSVHEGHFIKNANKYVRNVNRYKVYKFGNKTIDSSEVVAWTEIPE